MKRYPPFVVALLFASMLISCASTSIAKDPDPVRLSVVSEKELKSAYGTTFSINPYLEPKGMFRGKSNEFVVFRLDLDLKAATQVSISGSVEDSAGKVIARAMSLEDMMVFWEMWQASDADAGRRISTIRRSYVPGDIFTAKAGRKSYYFVVSGKFPLQRPAVIKAFAMVGSLPPLIVEQPLPDLMEE